MTAGMWSAIAVAICGAAGAYFKSHTVTKKLNRHVNELHEVYRPNRHSKM